MFELMVEDSFNSAHFLKGYQGNCKDLHGHNFKVQLFIKGHKLNEIGLLADYRTARAKLKSAIEKLDHKVLNEILDFNPTSELLAKYLFLELQASFIKHTQVQISQVKVWESEKTCASYSEE